MVELYDRISNPVNINTIDQILNCYCKSNNFYNGLVGLGTNDKETGKYNVYYNDQLNVFLFNKWKENILNYYHNLDYINPKYRRLFTVVAEYIYDKNPKNAREANAILNFYDDSNKELSDAMERLKWNSVGEYSSWYHIDSSSVLYGNHTRSDIEHRLYINSDSTYTHMIAYELVKRCHERRLKYYFKFDDYGSRNDTLVVYCSSKSLVKFINLLNEIKRDLKIDEHLHTPPLLTGKIDDWIGYGSEPEDVNGKRYSFNTKREEHLEKCINEETTSWIKRNINQEFIINKRRMTYKEYIALKLAKSKIKRLTKYASDDDNYYKLYGYRKRDLEDPRFELFIISIIKNNFDYIMNSLSDKKDFQIELKLGKGTIRFDKTDLISIIKDQTSFIMKVSSKYRYDLLDRIRRTSSTYDIDPNNYSFDISKKDALERANSNTHIYKKEM